MPLPANWNTVTVTATFTTSGGAVLTQGNVYFEPQRAIGMGADIVLPAAVTAAINGSGQITANLACPDDAGAGYTTLVYRVLERVPGGRSYFVELDNTMVAVELGDLDPLTDDQAAYYSLRGPTGPEGDVTPEALAAQAAAEAAAGAASASATAADASADAASSSAVAAAASATAAAGSMATGGIYATSAAGIAATTDGQYFSVPSAESAEYLILYKNNAGSALEIKRYPSATRVQTLETETANYRAAGDPIRPAMLSGFAWNVLDEIGKVAVGVQDDGTLVAKSIETAEISAQELTGLLALDVGADEVTSVIASNDYVWRIADAAGRTAIGVRGDGTVDIASLAAPSNPRPERFGGFFTHQWNYINGTGQSLAYGASGAITTAVEYDNAKFPYKSTAPTALFDAFRTDGEDPTMGTMGHVKELILEEHGITWQANDYRLICTNNAVSAMGIDNLSEGGSTGAYEACMSQLTAGMSLAAAAGKSFAFRAVTWTQGEADAGMSAATYKGKLMALAENFNADGKAITGQSQDVAFITYQNSSNVDKAVAVAQWQAAQDHPLIYLATPMYIFTYVDGQHINSVSTKWLGGYYGLVYKRVVIDGKDWQPLQPLTVVVSGNNIDIVFNRGGLVLDTTLVAAQASYGFGVVNAALSAQTINSVTLLPGNRVRLAMATTPAAGWRVRYGHNTATGIATYSGGAGNLRDRQGDFIQYAGHPMHNWCVIFDWEL